MKRIFRRIALLGTAAALTLSMAVPASATVYLDVGTADWFATAVEYAVSHGLLTGVAPNLFGPEQNTTRAMFYTVLARASGAAVDNGSGTNLTDVPAGKWYTGSVVWALSSGLTDTADETTFGAEQPITRGELCLALFRYDRQSGAGVLPVMAIPFFPDLGGVDAEMALAIASCQQAGVVQGRSDGRFDPHAGATRSEVAQILRNFFQLPGQTAPAMGEDTMETWDTVTGWTGTVELDFPLSHVDEVTEEQVLWLNQRILKENAPAEVAPYGCTIDGNQKHLTNYGTGGYHDCWNVNTILYNQKNDLAAGIPLNGGQQYYGYTLQVDGVARQDEWHQEAEETDKGVWQCTWWAWGRAAQYLDEAYGLDFRTLCEGRDNLGNGRDYYGYLKSHFLSDMTPSPNSLVSWSGGEYGHVAYVEAVDENGIWVSSADAGHAWRGVTYIPKGDDPDNPYPLWWHYGERCNGFNHLDFDASGAPIDGNS